MTKKEYVLNKLLLSMTDGGYNFNFRQFALRRVVGDFRNFFRRVRRCTYIELVEVCRITEELEYKHQLMMNSLK